MKAEYDFLQDRNNELEHENTMLHDRVTELETENMSLMDKFETLESGLPHPVTFDGKRSTSEYTLKDWLAKLKEEVSEVELEINRLGGDFDLRKYDAAINSGEDTKAINRLGEEITDLSTVCASFLNWLGWTIYGRAQLQARVNEKNKRRGYWE